MYKTFHPWFSLHFFVSFVEKNPPIKFHRLFHNFSRTYEVAKFWMLNCISTYLMPYMPMNKQNMLIVSYMEPFGSFLLMSFCFKMKKDLFQRKLLLWSQVPFKGFDLCWPSVPSSNYSLMPPTSTTFLKLKIRTRSPRTTSVCFSCRNC